MLALARYTLKGPYQAAAVIGLLAVLAVFVPLMAPNTALGMLLASICMLLSCILVGLIILTQGSVSGLKAIAVSVLGMTIVAWLLFDAPQFGLLTALVQWLPIIVLAQTLRSSRSLSLTMLIGLVVGALGVATQYLFWGDLEADLVTQLVRRVGQLDQVDKELMNNQLYLAKLFVQALVAMAYLITVLLMLAARWLQARLAGSTRFSEDFRALAFGKPAAAAGLVLMLSSFWLNYAWLGSLVFLLVIAFMFQGIAVVHSKLATRRQARLLLGVFYVMLLVFRPLVALTAVTGVVDNWLVFRKRPVKPDDENKV